MSSVRDPTSSVNQICQIGLENTANYTNLINSFGSVFVIQYVKEVTKSSLRKKRATYSYTCNDLNNMGSGIKSLSSDDLSTISLSDFYSCQTLLGSSSNSWSSSQLNILANKAKLV